MVNPLAFLRIFVSLLASARWVLLGLLAFFIVLNMTMYHYESYTFWETAYLSAITALTIGYGDITPKSWEGRLVAIGLGLMGIILTGVVVAAAIEALKRASPSQSG